MKGNSLQLNQVGRINRKVRRTVARWAQWYMPKATYSQEGEDAILARLFGEAPAGFYVDVGAYHPLAFSNTYLLYKRGWRGINIDPTPGVIEKFKKRRPRDINLDIAIGAVVSQATLYQFAYRELNTMSEQQVELLKATLGAPKTSKTVQVLPLAKVLEAHLPAGSNIDVLNVDVEGLDLAVLASNDWEKYRPVVVCVENLFRTVDEVSETPMHRFLLEKKYSLFSKTVNTCIYIDTAHLDRLLPLRKAFSKS